MTNYRITTELFTLNGKDSRKILYAPLLGFACEANDALNFLLANLDRRDDSSFSVEEEKILDHLARRGVLNSRRTNPPTEAASDRFALLSLTLFLTNRCNLRCGYCYAAAGQAQPLTMPWFIARSAVDFHITAMLATGKTVFTLEFHGGGEPFCAFALMQKCVAYARARCRLHGLTLEVTAATNGMLNENKLRWVIDHCRALTVSYEGLPHVQNLQRPRPQGRASFPRIDRALRTLDRHHFPYAIRTTVTGRNQDVLEETLQFIRQNYACRTWVIEPVQSCLLPGLSASDPNNSGRCPLVPPDQARGDASATSTISPADMERFAAQYIVLEKQAAAFGIRLLYSGAQFERLNAAFCHVGRNEAAVTPDGFLTNCWEVSSAAHPQADRFIFGRVLPQGDVQVDYDKWAALRALTVDHLEFCRDCFAKYHCGGGCALRRPDDGHQRVMDRSFCDATRTILLHRIEALLKNNYSKQPVESEYNLQGQRK